MTARTDSRAIAIEVLARVDKDDAWASRVLDAELKRAGSDRRDAGLAAEIVYGALRVVPKLDRLVAPHLDKKAKLDVYARAALRVGTYQLHHLSRVPAHSAVDASVEAVRRERGPRVAGFVNAVLRKVAAQRPDAPAPPTRLELPTWLRKALKSSLGAARTDAFVEARPLPPPMDLRVAEAAQRNVIAAALTDARPDATVELPEASDRVIRLRRAGDPRELPGFEEGVFTVQELGSQLVGDLVHAAPGQRVVDACAGRGGKTTQLARAVGPTGHVVALELHEARLEQIPEALRREGIDTPLTLACVDLTVGTGGFGDEYDVVLVDAPCTGVGTIHRRPEILGRLDRSDIARMSALQTSILEHAAALVRPGGDLVYAVCSPLRAEVHAAHALCASRADFTRVPWPSVVRDDWVDDDGVVRLGPWTTGVGGDLDAYQVVRLRRARA